MRFLLPLLLVAGTARANELAPMELNDRQISDLIAFLDSLTDPIAKSGRLGVPAAVPSGFSVE
jgi:cytochrome c peroxidase